MTEYKSADQCKVIFGPRIKYLSNAVKTPQTFCNDQTKIRKYTYGAVSLNLKRPEYYRTDEKLIAK